MILKYIHFRPCQFDNADEVQYDYYKNILQNTYNICATIVVTGEVKYMVVEKEVKEYSKRQRINLNKSDGFNDGDTVIILPINEFNEIKEQLMQLNNYKAKVEAYENGKELLKEITPDNTKDIVKAYEERLDKKDNELNEKDDEINRLKDIFSNYEKRVYGLNAIDVLFRRNKKLSDEFHNSIWIIKKDNAEITETKKISNK